MIQYVTRKIVEADVMVVKYWMKIPSVELLFHVAHDSGERQTQENIFSLEADSVRSMPPIIANHVPCPIVYTSQTIILRQKIKRSIQMRILDSVE